jgi:hypothetical protein
LHPSLYDVAAFAAQEWRCSQPLCGCTQGNTKTL